MGAGTRAGGPTPGLCGGQGSGPAPDIQPEQLSRTVDRLAPNRAVGRPLKLEASRLMMSKARSSCRTMSSTQIHIGF